ncbi:MAG: sigma-70 family RNA polymerase sigma factor [Actinobacteria bacterium]|nr:sigma-70 family RNA polymerase sigma factor [Actinomycetota bacterium]
MASNLARSDLRRKEAESRALGRLAQPSYEDAPSESLVARAAVDHALAGLSERQRRSFVLHYLEDCSVEQVANELGVSQGTVKQHLHRARSHLAAMALTPEAADTTERGGRGMKSWFLAGSHPNDYEHEVAEDETYEAKRVVRVRCTADDPSGFGTLMQMCDPGEYLERRVRFSGAARGTDVTGWAGLWFRVDGPGARMLAFDNMQERPIKGSTEWQRHDLVLDVVPEATALAYGVLLAGAGEVDVADFRFEVVGDDVPTTDRKTRLPVPENLDFSQD